MTGLLHLVLALQANQATVIGTVRDAQTAEPLKAAVVVLSDLDRLAVTDTLGAYLLRDVPAGPQHISVRLLGYEQRTLHALVPASGELHINISLRAEPIPLATLPVRPPVALRGVEGDATMPYPQRVVSSAAIRNHPLLAEPDAFQALSGGEVVLAPESPNGIHIRGGAADQTAYVLDGVPVFSPYHAAGLFSAWNPDALAEVRLTSAIPSPALPDALAGVVTGYTRRPGSRFSGQGSISSTQARITVDGPLGSAHGGYLLSLRSSYPAILAPGDEASYLNGESGDALAKLEARVFNGDLRIIGYDSENEIDVARAPDSLDFGVVDRRNVFEWHSRSVGAHWTRRAGVTTVEVKAWSATADASARWSLPADESANVGWKRRDEGVLIALRRNTTATTTATGVRAVRSETSYRVAQNEGAAPMFSLDARTPVALAFVEHSRSAGGSTQLDVAASVAAAAGAVHPAFAAQVRWSPISRLSLSGSFARLYQFTQSVRNAESIVGNIFPVDLHVGANAAGVPVARSYQSVLSAEYRPWSGLRIALQGYNRAARGLLLVAASDVEPFATGNILTGSGSARGLAVDVALTASRYGLIGGYGWQRTRLEHADATYTPEFAAAHVLETGVIVFPSATSSIRLGAAGLFGRRATRVTGALEWEACNLLDQGCEFAGTPRHDTALGATALPAYIRLDLGIRKHWHVEVRRRDASLAVFGTVTNVFGRKNVLNYAQDPITGQSMIVEMRPLSPLVVGLDWRF